MSEFMSREQYEDERAEAWLGDAIDDEERRAVGWFIEPDECPSGGPHRWVEHDPYLDGPNGPATKGYHCDECGASPPQRNRDDDGFDDVRDHVEDPW